MKTISFSCVEILPSLLDKSKVQTIRPLFRINQGMPEGMPKHPRLKIGDQVKLYWKQRSKYNIFCEVCGNAVFVEKAKNLKCGHFPEGFNKLLGTAEITEVFEIEMRYMDLFHTLLLTHLESGLGLKLNELHKLSKLDGFKSVEQMYNWFDKNYDLSESKRKSKRFAVYRWKWLGG